MFAYKSNPRNVITLEGVIVEQVNYYKCSNPDCELHKQAFNPSPTISYSQRRYGVDVLRYIANEFLLFNQKVDAIYDRIHKEYSIEISESTIRRICEDVLIVKAEMIDKRTLEMVKRNGKVLLALDGQDPGMSGLSIWMFTDCITNRVLATVKAGSMDHRKLNQIVSEILQKYEVELIGVVSDKQGMIVKWHDTYYPDVPHQYCQFHFLQNLWSHLNLYDNRVFMGLKKVIKGLYIMHPDKDDRAYVEGMGYVELKTIFKEMVDDLSMMLKVRTKKFKLLRGLWLYEKLEEYVKGLNDALADLDDSSRITKLLIKTYNKLREGLSLYSEGYLNTLLLFEEFGKVRGILGDPNTSKSEKERLLKEEFEWLYELGSSTGLATPPSELRSFLARSNSSFQQILGEWYRLYSSYSGGLLNYYEFKVDDPSKWRTNTGQEHAFSLQKQMLYDRSAKKDVSSGIVSYGELFLRLIHSERAELESDIVNEYHEVEIKHLREALQRNKSIISGRWRLRNKDYLGYLKIITEYILSNEKNKI